MNRRKKGILVCVIVPVMIVILLSAALHLPGESNSGIRQVEFSVPSGFYDEEFDLEMRSGGGTIYYTLDCSEPDEKSFQYKGPIRIKDASSNGNLYSAIRDVSSFLYPEIIKQEGRSVLYAYKVPVSPVDKSTVIRAVSIDGNGVRSEVTEAVYFVGYRSKSGYDGVNIMTITTSPENLFSSDRGIYVLGQMFADYKEEIIKERVLPYSWKANYKQQGVEWERDASVCLFDKNRDIVFYERCGIRIQGGASRAMLPKSFNLYARKAYGSKIFDIGDVFGDLTTLAYLNVNNGGQDNTTILKDYLVNTMAADLDIVTREYEPCAVFLDGEYWGNYWLTPRFKRDYMSQKYHESPENITVVKKGTLEEGDDEDLMYYKDMYRSIADSDMRRSENYEQACALLDMQSCIDYYALELYIANPDWPNKNYAMWRTRHRGTSLCSDCKWRWILYDVNSNMAMSLNKSKEDCIQHAINRDPLFASLMENEEFSTALYARLVSMAELFRPDKTGALIEAYKADMGDAMAKQYKRFYDGEEGLELFYRRCDSVQKFFVKRYDYIIQKYGTRD